NHPKVEAVLYPGLPEHPGYAVHQGQATGGGGVISFRVRGGADAACRVCSATRFFLLAESLGGVESLIEHPAIMTHASIPKDQREARGITDNLIRISVGIEAIEDLLEDLDQALQTV
ncbi:MAG TPA: PLP-dependent transferase, partial [Planctomycetota bacterium]|nr:PLP-dependent transferase [Planctomycetota bacterium]